MRLSKASILVVDDDPDVLTAVQLLLKTEVKKVVTEKHPERLKDHLTYHHYDIVLLDMNFNSSLNTGNEGLFWLREIRKMNTPAEVVMITAYGDIDLAVRSLKEGAVDFMVKPWHNQKLLEMLRGILAKKKGSGSEPDQKQLGRDLDLIGASEQLQDVLYKVEKIAPTDANILILGENGTGKDLIAQAIHQRSLRADKAFVKVDVGALSETLFESELFGYKKGAFTDAREDRRGRFQVADGGTLFLDEIGNIAPHQQAKLLSVLQNRQVIPLGSSEPIPVDIRLLCATNLSLTELADEKRFRKDLIYRINTVEIVVPPLRERGRDILLIADHFLEQYAEKYRKGGLGLSQGAKDKLLHYTFPGNVRELQYAIERAVIMSEGSELEAEDIIFSPIESAGRTADEPKDLRLSTVERNTILKVIRKNQGNITKAAKELGLTRTALYRRIHKYDI
ncbi:sigma-54-dependent transcriptional regulator [Flavilitoribacter nigricans]|uniref:Sigma-54-dependent Fis family transcriptional regulator n=1 Tax=Flavilitoribacter nigricans (strain ATCC 23147 / DSM 23189 / NBRC 102662 / NCIMB 1420 / SS-2) TaxID=1122177 RepID=A0A2D0NEC5_FLAN2|nr:sigma-54 dependent transcriptional regulator [Flavilitoribacter nigricans]PHN06758.1 sigma-54-dependent Fis family transcriptional regulator [Flavilitoribacter nigricans DSM 23189 = NBRC 102662]